jgi:hypothetical protein
MVRRVFAAALIATAIGLATARPHAAPRPSDDGDGYELWSDCGNLPDSIEFLPIYLASDSHGFIDLGKNETIGAKDFRALQYTRDKDFGQWLIRTGRWYGGLLAERWPLHTVDPRRLFEHLRVAAWEIDGTLYPVDPSCVWTQDTDDQSIGLFNIWVRFTTAGTHTLKIIYRQVAQFPFTDPLAAGADPFGLDGRRVLVKGEAIGDLLDEQFVHSYELVVMKEDAGATNKLQLTTNR